MNYNWSWAGKRALVTGGTGFIGQHIVKKLAERGAEVIVMTRRPPFANHTIDENLLGQVEFVLGSVTDVDFMKRIVRQYEIEYIFHLAAEAIVGDVIKRPWDAYHTNVMGTVAVLEAARACTDLVRSVVCASSDKAYGDHRSNLPYREGDALRGLHYYDASKAAGDLVAQAYSHVDDLPIRVTRCSNIFGPADLHFSRLIPGTIKRLFLESRACVRKSQEHVYREYTYVDDVAEAYLLLAESTRPLEPGLSAEEAYDQVAYNIGSGEVRTAEQVVRIIMRLIGRDYTEIELKDGSVGPELPSQYLATQKFRLEFPQWQPQSFEEGLKETIAWYQAFFESKRMPTTILREEKPATVIAEMAGTRNGA